MLTKSEIVEIVEKSINDNINFGVNVSSDDGVNNLKNIIVDKVKSLFDEKINEFAKIDDDWDEIGKPIDTAKAYAIMGVYKNFMDAYEDKVHRGNQLEKWIHFSRGHLSKWLDKKTENSKKTIGLQIFFSKYSHLEYPSGENTVYNRRHTVCLGITEDGNLKNDQFYNFGGLCPPRCTID